MKTTFSLLLFFLALFSVSRSQAQATQSDHFHDPEGNTYHQLFVDFRISEIVEMKYSGSDNTPVEGQLSADGYSVIIKNYPGDKSVILVVKDATGVQKEITKSRCFIDPVLLEL